MVACLRFRCLVCSTKSSSPFRGSSQSRGLWTQSVDATTAAFLFCPHYFHVFCSQKSLPPLQDGAEYPLTQSGPYGRWFHTEFCDFVSVLVAQCQHSVMFDGYLMSAVICLLTELSDSYVRAYRHTCTLAGGAAAGKTSRVQAGERTNGSYVSPPSAVKLLSALVGVALNLSVSVENSQRLYEVQKAKTLRQKSPTQLERMQRKITEVRPVSVLFEKRTWQRSNWCESSPPLASKLQEKRAEVESMMDALFKGVFLKRYWSVFLLIPRQTRCPSWLLTLLCVCAATCFQKSAPSAWRSWVLG